MTQATAVISNEHKRLNGASCDARVDAANQATTGRAIGPGRHCRRAGVVKQANFNGGSLMLTGLAAQADARYLVFCGANCMAEVAGVASHIGRMDLPHPACSPHQRVAGNAIRMPDRGKARARRTLQRMPGKS